MKRWLRRFQILSAVLGGALITVLLFVGRSQIQAYSGEWALPVIDQDAPYAKDIKKVILPLRYSGLPALMRPEVSLSLDPDRQTWTLHNIHRFDAQGNLFLDQERYGACGQLTAYTYQRIRPFLPEDLYNITFAKVAESGYFLPTFSTHYALRITERSGLGRSFLLDPSFHRYGPVDRFEDYLILEEKPRLAFLADHNTDQVFQINEATPIMIRNRAVVGLTVERINGQFDHDNFAITLATHGRHRLMSRRMLILRTVNGKKELAEHEALIESILNPDEYAVLRRRLIQFFNKL